MDQYIGKMLDNRYEILELIGRGGMANVYKAKCHRLNRLVAVKILKSDLADSAEFRRRFRDESLAVAQLSHANIVSVYDVSSSDDLDYIVMELIDGITLKQYMERRGKMDWREALHFIIQIMRGLSHAHSRGIVHRDIKPQNIMVLRDGSVKVADFGIACLANASQTLTQEALGSVHYISPEQARGDRPDARSDIYSAGVVLYEMLTGRLPFEGDSAVSVAIQHLSSIPLAPRDLNPDVPEALELITMKAMNPKLDKRYPSAEAMLEDLEKFRKDPSVDMEHIRSQLAEQPAEEKEPTQPLPVVKPAGRGSRIQEEESPENTREAHKRMIVIISAFAAALLLVFLIFQIIGRGMNKNNNQEPEYYTVPQLTGYTVEEARALDTVNGIFTIHVSGSRYDADYRPGEIIEQNPAADLTRSRNGNLVIDVVICAEEEAETMPDMSGKNYQEARAQLINLGLGLDIHQDEEFSDDVPAGQIIRTTPGVGETLKKGTYVLLICSKGPESKPVQMISFLDQSVEDAVRQAESMGLKVGQHVYEYSDKPDGTVIKQSIEPTATVEEGTTIVFTVSRGLRVVEVGSYIGSTIESASAAAQNAGLSVGASIYEYSSEPEGTVINQSLEPKLNVAEGTVITFTVSKGPEQDQYFTVSYEVDGIVQWSQRVKKGADTPFPDFLSTLTKEGYTFAGWSPQISPTVTADVTYVAQWTPIEEGGN
ncbi:MAG: Stk1 family PASTA domain-containing Ser/Thr kinase [Oscillospiraceae bacterium]|nr:Stk1 family PASTA domain-containing Ser/Thr kinase [Oscillospiraceae bacterium]